MSDTPATTAPPAVAPAATPAPAPAAPAAVNDSAPADAAPPTTPTPAAGGAPQEAAPAPTQAEYPSADEFGWDEWDNDAEKLPEQIRGWYSKFSELSQSQLDKLQTELKERQELQNIYEQLLAGVEEDPRVGELTAKLEEAEAKLAELQSNGETSSARVQELEASIEQLHDFYAKQSVERFKRENAELLADPESRKKVTELLDDWDLDSIPALVAMSDEQLEAAKSAKSEGMADHLAIKYATATVSAPKANKPRKSAEVTAGARPQQPASQPRARTKPERKPFDLSESRLRAAEKAFGSGR